MFRACYRCSDSESDFCMPRNFVLVKLISKHRYVVSTFLMSSDSEIYKIWYIIVPKRIGKYLGLFPLFILSDVSSCFHLCSDFV